MRASFLLGREFTDREDAVGAASPTLRLGLAGGIVAVLGALALGQIMRATLYETSPLDASVFVVALGVLGAALTVASYLPVRRAVRINPVDALRSE